MREKNTKQDRTSRLVARSIIKNVPTATTWVLELLVGMGELTLDAFFSPSIYADMPSLCYEKLSATKKKAPFKKPTVRQSIRRLEKQGFITRSNNKYSLTKKGKALIGRVLKINNNLKVKWDGKYRLVIFDIPEEKRKTRNWLRSELYFLGYKQLQKSVFIGKLPLPSSIIKEIKKCGIGNYVNYILAEKVYQNVF
ncbi:MAG TPA: CRISPR-associated endonuclease Cas2 [Candidatus Moranbacteria bacterium]|nr:CRISPR-associated endonuclease Cas2 [Candidatus Moranbacteria bacterium]HDZ85412.1 CRISPR-associated endonuclease Cas2 [Candidatus Moranbacteria bacterium]